MNKKFLTTVISVLLLAVIAVAGVLIYLYVRNGQKNFYVQYGSEQIAFDAENIVLPKDTDNVFYCKNVLGYNRETENAKNFTVTVILDKDKLADFTFEVDAEKKQLYDTVDVTQAFTIRIYDGYFTFRLPAKLTAYDLLQAMYPNKTVVNVPDIDLYEKDCLTLVVYSKDEDGAVTIGFH